MKKFFTVIFFLTANTYMFAQLTNISFKMEKELPGEICREGHDKEIQQAKENGEIEILSYFKNSLMKEVNNVYHSEQTGYYKMWEKDVYNTVFRSSTSGVLSGLDYRNCRTDKNFNDLYICEVCLDVPKFKSSQEKLINDISNYLAEANREDINPGERLLKLAYALALNTRLLLLVDINGTSAMYYISDKIEEIMRKVEIKLDFSNENFGRKYVVFNFTCCGKPITNIPFEIDTLNLYNCLPDESGKFYVESDKFSKINAKQLKINIAWDKINYPFKIDDFEKTQIKSLFSSFDVLSKIITIPENLFKPVFYIEGEWIIDDNPRSLNTYDIQSLLQNNGYPVTLNKDEATVILKIQINTFFSEYSNLADVYFYKSVATITETINGNQTNIVNFDNIEQCKEGYMSKNKAVEYSKRCMKKLIKQKIKNQYTGQ